MLKNSLLALSTFALSTTAVARDIEDLGGGEYSVALAPTDSVAPVWEAGILWQYDGQQVFSYSARPPTAYEFKRRPREPRAGLAESLVGTVRVDRKGRRWVAVDVDESIVEGRIAARLHEETVMYGLEPVGPEETLESRVGEEDVGLTDYIVPWAWDWETCNGVAKAVGVWDSESRYHSNGNLYTAPKKSVVLWYDQSGQGSWVPWCNGTVVDTERVLTAGHCLFDFNDNQIDADRLVACSWGNNYTVWSQCQVATDVYNNPEYDPEAGSDVADDYGVLAIGANLGVGYMAISSASDSVIESANVLRASRPGKNPQTPGAPCTNDPVLQGGINANYPGGRVFVQVGDIPSTPAGKVCSTHDGSVGESGSGFYYHTDGCWQASCTSSHYLLGVMSGPSLCDANPLTYYSGGPKGRDIKTWVLGTFP